jgi:hypothetical protein
MEETIRALGHENVTATHGSTFEFTSDDFLTPAGDCILGIDAHRVPADFRSGFVTACQDSDATITATIETDDYCEEVIGRGDPDLTFENERSIVARTSEYLDDRTVMVEADTAAAEFDRDLVAALADGAAVTVTLSVE